MKELEKLRKELDQLDSQLLDILATRRQTITKVGQLKKDSTSFLKDNQREEQLLTDLVKRGQALGLDGHFVTSIFRQVLEQAKCRKQFVSFGR